MENPNLTIKDRFVAAVLAGDTSVLGHMLDPAFELHQSRGLPYGGMYKGRDGFLKFIDIFAATYTIEHLENTDTMVSVRNPDVIVAEFRFRGTLKSSGNKFDTTMLETWEFKNGKILRIKPHYFEAPR